MVQKSKDEKQIEKERDITNTIVIGNLYGHELVCQYERKNENKEQIFFVFFAFANLDFCISLLHRSRINGSR
jgi:hypothetical protein